MEQRGSERTAVTRRQVLSGGILAGGLVAAGAGGWPAAAQTRSLPEPFTLGVASGDPEPDGVVLWTRLAPDPLDGGGMPPHPVPVAWEVATDEGMRHVARRGVAVALPQRAHTVHVEVTGLRPARWYWYRFRAAGHVSRVGRTRTAPARSDSPDRLRFAFASCQAFQDGFWPAYRAMAAEDLDLVVHLGDYIYEVRLLDTRQYRTDQPCGDGIQIRCPAALDPAATMTGPRSGALAAGRPRPLACPLERDRAADHARADGLPRRPTSAR